MKKDFKINPVGLKGNEINERMKQLMGIAPINENVSRSVVELTKMGPDGKAYAIVRENHEYYIKVSNKTSNLVTEDFNYIGGLQNKKKEAYPSYAKATKHLNLSFKSLAEAYGTDSNINVFEDDDLLNEENFASKHVVDKKGHELKQESKEGSEEDGFGDNLANGKTKNDIEKVKKIDEAWAGFAEMTGNGFVDEGMFGDDIEMSEEEQYIDKMIEDNGNDFYRTDAENQIPNPPSELNIPVNKEGYMEEDMYDESYMEENMYDESYMEEELHGNQGKIDMNHNGEVDSQDLSMLRNMNEEGEMSNDELMDKLDNMSASELIQMLGDAGRDLKGYIANKLSTGMDKARDYFDRQYPDVDEAKQFPDLTGDGEVTRADILKGRGVDLNEALTLEEIKEAIADLKKKL